MSMNPFVVVFCVVWLTIVGGFMLLLLFSPAKLHSGSPAVGALFLAGMFLFGVGLICGCFFPEALKARRILTEALANPSDSSSNNP